MKRWLPYPGISLFVALTSLVLNQSLAPGHIAIAIVLGLALGAFARRLELPALRMRRWSLLPRLALVVIKDIIRSNISVLRIVLGGKWREVTSGFVELPLQLSNPYALVVLACIITATPGTIWMSFRSRESVLLIHVFDLVDEREWVRMITRRYVEPLREIFE